MRCSLLVFGLPSIPHGPIVGYKLFIALRTVEYRDFASFEAKIAVFGGYIGQWSIPFGCGGVGGFGV